MQIKSFYNLRIYKKVPANTNNSIKTTPTINFLDKRCLFFIGNFMLIPPRYNPNRFSFVSYFLLFSFASAELQYPRRGYLLHNPFPKYGPITCFWIKSVFDLQGKTSIVRIPFLSKKSVLLSLSLPWSVNSEGYPDIIKYLLFNIIFEYAAAVLVYQMVFLGNHLHRRTSPVPHPHFLLWLSALRFLWEYVTA